jgi:hypothetical protein
LAEPLSGVAGVGKLVSRALLGDDRVMHSVLTHKGKLVSYLSECLLGCHRLASDGSTELVDGVVESSVLNLVVFGRFEEAE